MRIWIQLFNLMRIHPDADPDPGQTLKLNFFMKSYLKQVIGQKIPTKVQKTNLER